MPVEIVLTMQSNSMDSLTLELGDNENAEADKVVDNKVAPEITALIESPKPVPCDVCRYKKRETFARDHCSTCAINMCEDCKGEHDRHIPFRAHAAVPVAQRDRSVLKCEQHESEFVRYFCTLCLSPLCAVCAVIDHVGHPTRELNEVLIGKRDAVEINIRNISECVVSYEETLTQLEDLQGILEAAVKKTRMEIESHTAELIDAIHKKQQNLIDELESCYKTTKALINREQENYSTQLASMKSLWKFAAKLTEPGQALQLLVTYDDVAKMIDRATKADVPRLPQEAMKLKMFVPKQQLTVGELQTCNLSVDLIKRVSSVNSFSSTESSRAVSPVPSVKDLPSPVGKYKYQTPKLLWKTDKVGQRTGEINEAYDVALFADGTVAVAEWLNMRLQIFDVTGYTRNIFGQGHIQPWGIAITPDGMLAITDEKDRTVKVFNSTTGSLISSWKKNMFGLPRGISINSSGQVIVSDGQLGKHCVGIYLPDGQCLNEFGSQGNSSLQFHWPRYIAVDCHQNDRIIVSDGSNHCIKVFDATGQFMFKFGSHGSGDGCLKHPRGVAVDCHGNILVADQDNNRLSLFSSDGHFLKHVLRIHKPCGISLNDAGLMAVSHKHTVSLYRVFDDSSVL